MTWLPCQRRSNIAPGSSAYVVKSELTINLEALDMPSTMRNFFEERVATRAIRSFQFGLRGVERDTTYFIRAEGDRNLNNDPNYTGSKAIFLKPKYKRIIREQRCLVSSQPSIDTSLLWKWSIMSEEDIRGLPDGLVKLEDLKPVKRGVDPLYITMDLAYMFDVTNEATYYWDRSDKLKPYNESREKNQPKLYRQSDIVEFLKCAYRGDYQPSTVNIYRAIKYMDVTVDLPEKRTKDSYLKSHEKQRGTSKGEYKRRAIPTISEGEPQVKLYSTIEVAQLMEVSPKTVNYWTVTNKLSFYTRQNNYGYFYTVTSMVKFLKEMHMGKYKNSQLNIQNALANMGLTDEVELPETERGKVMKQVKDNKVYNIKHPFEIVIDSNKHVKLKSREAYFKSIAKFGTKKRDS